MHDESGPGRWSLSEAKYDHRLYNGVLLLPA